LPNLYHFWNIAGLIPVHIVMNPVAMCVGLSTITNFEGKISSYLNLLRTIEEDMNSRARQSFSHMMQEFNNRLSGTPSDDSISISYRIDVYIIDHTNCDL